MQKFYGITYQGLAKLEYMGKKSTIAYQSIIAVIRKLLDYEMILYDKIGSNKNKVLAISAFLDSQFSIFDSNRLETAINMDRTKIIIERINQKFADRSYVYVGVNPNFHQAIGEIGIFDQTRLIRTLFASVEMKHIIPSVLNLMEMVEADHMSAF